MAKGVSQVQACLDQSKPYGKSFSINHPREELDHFIGFLKEIEEVTGQMPMVILESSGHYHTPVIQYLEEKLLGVIGRIVFSFTKDVTEVEIGKN
ncbi:hypothetical protein QNH43_15555 [Peribacillus simplex]|nr:hypothetical protein [Peribacillus simplex]WHY54598.1 hypothetical protein QNH43_15555 [Peribacillus simplex]